MSEEPVIEQKSAPLTASSLSISGYKTPDGETVVIVTKDDTPEEED